MAGDLNPSFQKINVLLKFLFTHSAEKRSGPVDNGIFGYPCRVLSPLRQYTNKMVLPMGNPTVKFVGNHLFIIHKCKRKSQGFPSWLLVQFKRGLFLEFSESSEPYQTGAKQKHGTGLGNGLGCSWCANVGWGNRRYRGDNPEIISIQGAA